MAKLFDYTFQLPMTNTLIGRLREAAKSKECAVTTLARNLLVEGLERIETKIAAGQPKNRRKESDYGFHMYNISELAKPYTEARFSREHIDWYIERGIVEIDGQNLICQLEPNWAGKHDGESDDDNPYEGFYHGNGGWLTQDSPTMKIERERGLIDWDRRRKSGASGLVEPNTQPAQHTPSAAIATPTTGTVVLTRTVDQPDTPTKSLEQLLSDD